MGRKWQVFLAALALIGQASAVTSLDNRKRNEFTHFTSRASQLTLEYGEEISLSCSVAEGYEDIKLDWWLVDYEVQLSNGPQLLIQSENHHLHYNKKSDGNCSTTLTISAFQPPDSGYYKCQFTNSSGVHAQLSRLVGADSQVRGKKSYDYEDMTECCKAFGITGKCLKLCSPFELFLAQTEISSKTEFKECGESGVMLALMECGSGRNNIACCLERNVSSQCSTLCNGKLHRGSDLMFCSEEMVDLALCFSRGLASIPPPVEKIHFMEIQHDHIMIKWSFPPWNHGDDYDEELNTRFVIIQWENSRDVLPNYKLIHAGGTEMTAWNLSIQNNSFMKVSIVSANQHGASAQTTALELSLFPTGPAVSSSSSLSECCKNRDIPIECQPMLCGFHINDESVIHHSCHQYYGIFSQCLAASEADKRNCCLHRVSLWCLPLCGGTATKLTLGSFACHVEMPYIKSCLEQNKVALYFTLKQFAVSGVTCCSSVFSWLPVKQTAIQYILRYKEVEGNHFTDVSYNNEAGERMNKAIVSYKASIAIEDLKPGTEYEAIVVVVQDNQTSLPANSIKFRTKLSQDLWTFVEVESPSISMQNQELIGIEINPPTSLVPIGHRVTMNCFTQLPLTCHWVVNSVVIDKSFLDIWSANEKSSGVYTCVCGKDHKSHTLSVQSAPTIIYQQGRYEGVFPQRVVYQPLVSHLAEITCYFLGFPSTVTWYKDGQELAMTSKNFSSLIQYSLSNKKLSSTLRNNAAPNNSHVSTTTAIPTSYKTKYVSTKYSLESQGVLYYKLSIEPFESSDVGTYTCTGSNRYASDSGTVHLTTDNSLKETTFSKEHPALVSDCCRELKVSSKCIAACSFDVDVKKLLGLNWECYGDFNKIMYCSSRGWNYSSCCLKVNIPTRCISLCQGGEIESESLAYECINYANEIINCHANGHSLTPSPPSNVNLTVLLNGLIVIQLSEPVDGSNMVSGYSVNWTSNEYPHLVKGYQVLSSEDQLIYFGYMLQSFQSYTFTVQSYNRHSFSVPYTMTEVLVKEPPILERLEISIKNEDYQILILWKEVKYKYIDKLIFAVYDGTDRSISARDGNPITEKKELFRVIRDPLDIGALIIKLETGKGYFVVGWIRSSNYEGPLSDAEYTFIPRRSFVGGMILVVLLCISIGTMTVIAAWIIIGVKFRRKKTLSQDSVTFENSAPTEIETDQQINIPRLFSYHEFENDQDDGCSLTGAAFVSDD